MDDAGSTCLDYATMPSPAGPVGVAWSDRGIERFWFVEAQYDVSISDKWIHRNAVPDAAHTQLTAYFAGELQTFDLPLVLRGTAFQLSVWEALCGIPYGTTASYGDIAERLGQPGASRAVGGANHRNPLPIVIPCHRVVAANGALGGYAGGVRFKRFLLDLELRGSFGSTPT